MISCGWSCSSIRLLRSGPANAQARKPEIVALRDELATAKRQLKDDARQAAQDRRELERAIATYANQIQILALRTSELAEENQQLRQRLERDTGVVRLG